MITSSSIQQHILKAMQNGAKLVLHVRLYGTWNDGCSRVFKVTLERGTSVLTLSTLYREDEYHFVPCDEDGACWLRHGVYSRPPTGKDIADGIVSCEDVRDAYAGYRGDNDSEWREIYEHISQPLPAWIGEPREWSGL